MLPLQFNDFREKYNKENEKYLQWMFSSQKPYNAETDYEQIEELYDKALNGALIVNYPDKEPGAFDQIAVKENGQSCIVKNDPDRSRFNVNSIVGVIGDIKSNSLAKGGINQIVEKALNAYEQKNGPLAGGGPLLTDFREKKPKPVPAPNGWSWFKRIISFGAVKDDFTKYDAYKDRLNTYETHKKEHMERTEAQYNAILKFINESKEAFGLPADVKNPELLEDNYSITSLRANALKPHPEHGIFDESFVGVRARMEHILMNQIKDAPDTVNPDGTFNKEKVDAYWAQKKELLPEENVGKTNRKIGKLKNAKAEYDREYGEMHAKKMHKNIKEKNKDVELINTKADKNKEQELPELDPKAKRGFDFAL